MRDKQIARLPLPALRHSYEGRARGESYEEITLMMIRIWCSPMSRWWYTVNVAYSLMQPISHCRWIVNVAQRLISQTTCSMLPKLPRTSHMWKRSRDTCWCWYAITHLLLLSKSPEIQSMWHRRSPCWWRLTFWNLEITLWMSPTWKTRHPLLMTQIELTRSQL